MDVRVLNRSKPTGQRGQQIVSGYVSTEQPAPVGFDDPVYVVVGAHSSALSYALPWPATHGNTKPAPGAYVALQFDENNKPSISSWEGAHS